jgi:WD40 repeat protein
VGPGGGGYYVDAWGASGVQVGEGCFQANYTYNLTWTDGVAPPPLASVSGVVVSPYRGLGSFEERDAAFFFGREDAATEVLGRMSRLAGGRGVLMVSGASGAGKSSLLRAGVLPRLRGAGLAGVPGAARWPCVVFSPGRAPLDELTVRVAPLAGADAAAVRRGLASDPGGFALTARQAALAQPADLVAGRGEAVVWQPGGERLLLVVDQFEQVFTLCEDPGEREAFIAALCAAASADKGGPAALVVLGVRADFEVRCAAYPGLAGVVQDRYLVQAMTGRQLRMAITGPARVAGSQVDDELAGVLLAEVRARQPGAAGTGVLPLLSHALDQAWRSRAGKALTLADYERTGGIEAAVAASAERAYGRLTAGQRRAARQVFIRLAAASPDGTDTADRATRAELAEGMTAAGAADVEAVLEAFAAERLLTLAADSVEISHEALLGAWPLLRDTWLAESHADRVTRTRLRATAADWERRSRDPAYLYRGTLLQAATEAAGRIAADPARNPALGRAERDFLRASDRARRRAARWRQAAVAGLAALALAATAIAVVAASNAAAASRNADIATRDEAIALSRQLAADSLTTSVAPWDSRQLAVAAWSVYPTSQAAAAMATLLAEQQQQGTLFAADSSVEGVAFSPDGKLLATVDDYGTVRLWNPDTGQPAGNPMRAGTREADGGGSSLSTNGVAFSPDGKLLASADGADGTVRLWNTATGKRVGKPLPADPGGGVDEVAFSPDGKLLATADGGAGTVRLWDTATGTASGNPLPADTSDAGIGDPETGVDGVAFSPNGRLLATATFDGGTVLLWNPATGKLTGKPLNTGSGGVDGVAFSPNGRRLATADDDGTVRLWNPATGKPVGRPLNADTGPHGGVDAVAFSPDGNLLATADEDGTVRLWNPATGKPVRGSLYADASGFGVDAVAFSPDGKLLASADGDGTVRLWNPATGRPPSGPLPAGPGGVNGGVDGVAFSPDGKLLASAEADDAVQLWNPADGEPAGILLPADTGSIGADPIAGVAFSPDGKLLAAADGDGTVRLWNPVTGQLARRPLDAAYSSGPNGGVNGVAFSPDGKLLAAADADGTVRLWNPVTGQPARRPLDAAYSSGPNGGVNGVAFSPDGKLLASADEDGTVRLWNPVTGRPPGRSLPADPGGRVIAVAFSPDGHLLATADGDGTVRLWNLFTGQPVGRSLPVDTEPDGAVLAVAFSPDGSLLATAADDGTVQLWNPFTGQPVGGPIPADPGDDVDGVAFSPGGRLLASADGDGTIRLWRVPLFTNPYQALCADVGPPSRQEWEANAPGQPFPKTCVSASGDAQKTQP